MIRSREVLSATLDHSLLANRVVAALNDGRGIPDEKQRALDSALDFLRQMLKGREFSKSLSIQDDTYQAALAYGDGIRAFNALAQNRVGDDRDPGGFLQALVDTATQLRNNSNVDPESLQELTSFFRLVRDLSLIASTDPIEKVIFE